VGIIYQLNVAPGARRKLVGAMLIKAMFERASYGCKLFCCWCAQDIEANHFWESIGFIPLAFRTGSRGKGRTHIFWQRRIREGDTRTPFWFPAKTGSGSLREDRLVLPIPPGVHWKDIMPTILPESAAGQLEDGSGAPKKRSGERREKAKKPYRLTLCRDQMRFVDPNAPAAVPKKAKSKPKRAAQRAEKPKAKCAPAHVAAARELRDRYLEQFNSGNVLPNGKYEVSRALPIANCQSQVANLKALPEAA
jgi:hypothetical protein